MMSRGGSMRSDEDGWVPIAVPDGRRGLWMKVTPTTVELCAGREGDDAYVKFEVGEAVSKSDVKEGLEVLDYFVYALDVQYGNATSIIDGVNPGYLPPLSDQIIFGRRSRIPTF
jgi:hypothetical protein